MNVLATPASMEDHAPILPTVIPVSVLLAGKAVDALVVCIYRKVSNIRRTKSQNLNDSCLVLQLSLPNRLKPGVKSIMKM